MKTSEGIARFIFVLIVIGLPAAVIVSWLLPRSEEIRVVEIQAYVPEAGGFMPASIQVDEGETVTLRFTSMDVTHSVAIGPGLGLDLGQIEPGHSKEITFTFEQAGSYTFYCTTWCSDDHWRMRGVVDVVSADLTVPASQTDAVVERLIAEGVDIDAGFFSRGAAATLELDLFSISGVRGAQIADGISFPNLLLDPEWRRTHTPAEAFVELRIANPKVETRDLIDVVAHLWLSDTQHQPAVERYNQNCAACHGQYGNGDGPAAQPLLSDPGVFADPDTMFHMRADVLYAKIRRGGMGTEMPNFGTLFTSDKTWALVDYLWELSFDGIDLTSGRPTAIWSFLESY